MIFSIPMKPGQVKTIKPFSTEFNRLAMRGYNRLCYFYLSTQIPEYPVCLRIECLFEMFGQLQSLSLVIRAKTADTV